MDQTTGHEPYIKRCYELAISAGKKGYDTFGALKAATLYTSCAPCERCLMAIASLGIERIVYGVSYAAFGRLLPFEPDLRDYESLLRQMGVTVKLTGPVLEEEGMHVFEYWGGEWRPLSELLAESAAQKRQHQRE